MSHITKLKTTFRDPECILQALLDQGFTRQEVLRCDTPMDVDGGGKAEIVVGKTAIQRATTRYPYTGMGFKKQEDGTYELLIDQFTFHKDWTDGLQQRYNTALSLKTAKIGGWIATETKGENGAVKITLRR